MRYVVSYFLRATRMCTKNFYAHFLVETKQFVCPICHRAFKTMHVFRGHMNGKHSDTWYSCGFCKFTTSHKKSMKRHMVLGELVDAQLAEACTNSVVLVKLTTSTCCPYMLFNTTG